MDWRASARLRGARWRIQGNSKPVRRRPAHFPEDSTRRKRLVLRLARHPHELVDDPDELGDQSASLGVARLEAAMQGPDFGVALGA